jgi:hypothetical protein
MEVGIIHHVDQRLSIIRVNRCNQKNLNRSGDQKNRHGLFGLTNQGRW